MADELGMLRSEREGLDQRVGDLETAKAELERKVLELAGQPTVELDKIVVSDTGPESEVPSTVTPVSVRAGLGSEGQVLVVNLEYGFIVMSLGRNHGISLGQEFKVVRGAEVVGRVKVEKLYDDLSAATVLSGSDARRIREGDRVKAI